MPFGEFPEIRRRNFTRPPGKERNMGHVVDVTVRRKA